MCAERMKVRLPRDKIADLCRRHHIRKLAVFGLVLRGDARPDSDLDVLVEFELGHMPGLAFFVMEQERSELLGRKVDLNAPQNDAQRLRQAQALQLSTELAQKRWLLVEQSGSSIPMPFVVLLTFWVTVIFVSFGLFAPSNATVIVTLLICALSVSGAIFLILELDQPFEGLIQISNAPLHNALAHLGQ
jgi:predicted nucleotidyltransferase